MKEGEFEFRVGDQTVRGKPGSYVLAPSGVPHIFKNVGTTTGHVTVRISPPGFEEFFVEVDALGESPPLEKLMELAEEFGLEILPP